MVIGNSYSYLTLTLSRVPGDDSARLGYFFRNTSRNSGTLVPTRTLAFSRCHSIPMAISLRCCAAISKDSPKVQMDLPTYSQTPALGYLAT